MSRPAEIISLPIIFGSLALALWITESRANDTHLDHYYEEQMKKLGKIVFPPHFDGSYQSLHANGATVTSNVPRRGERKCRQQVGIEGGRAVIFQHCGPNGETQ